MGLLDEMNSGAVETVKNSLDECLDNFEEVLLLNLKDNGDTAEECQKMCILENLNQLRYSVNGIESSDLF